MLIIAMFLVSIYNSFDVHMLQAAGYQPFLSFPSASHSVTPISVVLEPGIMLSGAFGIFDILIWI